MIKEIEISEVFDIIRNGYSVKQSSTSKGVPITRIETISNRVIDESKLGYANLNEDNLGKAESYLLEPGDILMTHINSISHLGKCAIYQGTPKKLIHGMNLLCLRANEDVADPKYLLYYFNSIYFKSKLNKYINPAVNQASVSTGNLKKLSIPLPPLETQKKIAEILDAADTLRQKTKTLIEKYDQLTQSLFLDMFGDPATNPKKFEIVKIRDLIVEAKYGTSLKSQEHGEYPYLRMNNITYSGYMNYSDMKYIDIKDSDKQKYIVKKGDIVFNRTNSKDLVGKTGLITNDDEMVIAGYLIRLRTNKFANPYYLWGHLNSKWAKINLKNMCKNIIGMANINAQELQEIKILKAPLPLQNQFAERVQDIEEQKVKAQVSLEKSEELFQSLLQKAFKGEIN